MPKLLCTIFIVLTSFGIFASKDKWDADKSDWSALMKAVYKGKHKKIERLIARGADVNYANKSGLTALLVAIRKQDTTAMKLLLETGRLLKDNADFYVTTACMYKSKKIVELLVSNGYPVKTDENNYTPLMAACSFGSAEIVKYLLNSIKIDPNTQRSIDGITALMLATDKGEVEKVRLLLDAGANPGLKDKNGHTALTYADRIPADRDSDRKAIIQLIGQ